MSNWDAQTVRVRLRGKAARDPGCTRHGAHVHRYELAAPCPIRKPRPCDENRRYDEDEGLTLGTLMLAEQGCGMYSRLILNGPPAGQVWHLDQDFGTCVPESPDFRTWYADWLET